MLINLSNHPSSRWSTDQTRAAADYGETMDLPFPSVDPWWTVEEVEQIADLYVEKVLNLLKSQNPAPRGVHIMGELTLCFALIKRLQERGISCIASTTERLSVDNGSTRVSEFRFCRFREYPRLADADMDHLKDVNC